MSDSGLRDLERAFRAAGGPREEARYLAARVRAGQLSHRALVRAALLGNEGARISTPNFSEGEPEDVPQEDMNEVLQLVFGSTELPPRTREFLANIVQHDREARLTLEHCGLVEEGDKAPPDTATALKALTDDLKDNQNHREAIGQMNRPVLQLIPIYEPEGAGFQRMVNALDARSREGQVETYVNRDLRTRWKMGETPGKIVRWQVAVTEGAKVLPPESNRYLEKDGVVQRLEDQLSGWQQDCKRRSIQLCDKKSYGLLQMQELRQAEDGADLGQLGIDPENWTVLDDPTRQTGSLVPSGGWVADGVGFDEGHPDSRYGLARFRFSVVVDVSS